MNFFREKTVASKSNSFSCSYHFLYFYHQSELVLDTGFFIIANSRYQIQYLRFKVTKKNSNKYHYIETFEFHENW